MMPLTLGLYLFGFLTKGLTTVKYIGLYSSILIFLIDLIKDRVYLNHLIQTYKRNRVLLNSLILFIGSVILSIIFAYGDSHPSIREFRAEFLNISIFALLALSIPKKRVFLKVTVFAIVLAFIFNAVNFGFNHISNYGFDFSQKLDRNYAFYFEIIYPFILGSFILIKSRVRYLIAIFFLIALTELILTGVRGVWISFLAESILFLTLLIIYVKREYIKQAVMVSLIFILTMGGGISYLYSRSDVVKSAVERGLKPNGRDRIIETRFPIFMEKANLITGVGGPGNYQYNRFLIDNNAPKIYLDQKECRFYADEPFLLQILYKEGIIGTFLFLLLIVIFTKELFSSIKGESNLDSRVILILTISSLFGYYIVRGLVEGRSFKYIILYITLLIIVKEADNEDSSHLSRKATN